MATIRPTGRAKDARPNPFYGASHGGETLKLTPPAPLPRHGLRRQSSPRITGQREGPEPLDGLQD
eukprot:5183338-Pyramimonas_sp.AAC.1